MCAWPSPAEEELLDNVSFDEWLIEPSTFMVKVGTDAMQDAGIQQGDIAIFRRGQRPKRGDIVVASIDTEWLIRFYEIEEGKPVLYPANGKHNAIHPSELVVIGVLRSIVRKY